MPSFANVAVTNTIGLYGQSANASILNNATVLLGLLSENGNVNFALDPVTSNTRVLAYTANIGTPAGTYGNYENYPIITVGADGRVTNVSEVSFSAAGIYGNANVAAYLPTYTGSLDNSSSIINLWSNAATQQGEIDTLSANLGAFEIYANSTFTTTTYSNANVAAYLPGYTGLLGGTLTSSSQPNIATVGTLNSLTTNGNITILSGSFVGDGQYLTGVNASSSDNVIINVKNTSGGTLTKGTPVYATGTVGVTDVYEVSASRADTSSTMPAIGLLAQTLANNAFGTAIQIGLLSGVNTNSYTANQVLYINITGGLTTTRPNDSYLVQPIGSVGRVNASTGSIFVNIWNTLQVPNLGQGNVWVGPTGGGLPVEQAMYGNTQVAAWNLGQYGLYVDSVGMTRLNGQGNTTISIQPTNTLYLGAIGSQTYLNGNIDVTTQYGKLNIQGYPGITSEVVQTTMYVQNGANVKFDTGSNLNMVSGSAIRIRSGSSILGAGNISITGNTTASYFIGNGSQLTGLPAGYGNANVAAYLPTYSGNVGGTLSTASQPYITTLASLTSAGSSATTATYSSLSLTTVQATSGGVKLLALGNSGNVDLTAYSGANYINLDGIVKSTGNVSTSGNLIASGNVIATSPGAFVGSGQYLNNLYTPVRIKIKCVNAGGIIVGCPVYATGPVGANNVFEVDISRTDTPSTLPSIGIAEQTLTYGSEGTAIQFGYLTNLGSTSGWAQGQTLFVSNTGGYVSTTRTAYGVPVQPIATVANIATGSIFVNIQSVLSLPNLGSGNVWVGPGTDGEPVQLPYSGPSSYGNTQVAAYLPTYTGAIGATSVGTLTSLTVTGNVTTGNVSGTKGTFTSVAGTLLTAAQTNITSVGTLTSLTSSGNITASGGAYFLGDGSKLSLTNYTGYIGSSSTSQYLRGLTASLTTAGGTVILQADGSLATGPIIVSGDIYVATGNIFANTAVGQGGYVTVANTATANKFTSTTGYFWANGTAYSTPSSYGNTQVAAYLPTYTGTLASSGFTANVSLNNNYVKDMIIETTREKTVSLGTTVTGAVTINANSGPIQTMTVTGNITINTTNMTNWNTGQSVTLVITQDATGGRALTSNLKYAGGSKTLSTGANAIDTISITYDGTNYLAALVKGYA